MSQSKVVILFRIFGPIPYGQHGWKNQLSLVISELLKSNSTIQEISWSNYCYTHSPIGVEGVTLLAESLKINSSIQNVNLQENDIGTDGAAAIAQALRSNSSIRKLRLDSNEI